MIYNVMYYDASGRRQADYDTDVSRAYIETSVVRMCREHGWTAECRGSYGDAYIEVSPSGITSDSNRVR